MKQLALALTFLLLLSANKCSDKGGSGTSLLDSKWVVRTLAGESLQLPPGTETPWLQLAGDQVQGFGGCNQLMGSYKLSGSSLLFSGVGSTKKFCEGVQPTERAIMEMLPQVETYRLSNGTLKLMGGGKELATLVQE